MNNRQRNKRVHKFIDLHIRFILTAVVTFFLITGCASSYQIELDTADRYSTDKERLLREEIKLWIDTPHAMGGKSYAGIDCSAFVMTIYDKLFGIMLPRDTENQVAIGVSIDKHELKPGDLVFFKPPRIRRHVGIYLSNGEFVHTSSRKGVTISRIDDPYWDKSYWTSRRILP